MHYLRRSYLLLILVLALALTLIAIALYPKHTPSKSLSSVKEHRKALIADGLYDLFPNDELIKKLSSTLKSQGYDVTVVLNGDVNLNLFLNLTSYDLIILRLHGGYGYLGGKEVSGLFTGVKWTYKYFSLAKKGYVAKGVPFYARERAYVALLPKFFRELLEGKFRVNATVIAAGCYTASSDELIEALFNHNLKYYVGWKGAVTVDHLDRVLYVLIGLISEGYSLEEAVKMVNKILGPDPKTGELLYVFANKNIK